MEALRTQVDSLKWEVQRLEVENRRIREQNPVGSERVDCEAELERAKTDVTEMATRMRTLEQLADSAGMAREAGRRTTEAEERAVELQERIEELSAMHLRDATTAGSGTPNETTVAELEEALGASKDKVRELEAELSQAREARYEVAAEGEAIQERAKLERYRALEAEQRKWEERERCLLDCLEEELRTARRPVVDTATAGQLEAAEKQLQTLTQQLGDSQTLVRRLSEEQDALRRDHSELEELRAELGSIKAAQQQAEEEESGRRRVQFSEPAETEARPVWSGGVGDSTGVTTMTWMGSEGMLRMGVRSYR